MKFDFPEISSPQIEILETFLEIFQNPPIACTLHTVHCTLYNTAERSAFEVFKKKKFIENRFYELL